MNAVQTCRGCGAHLSLDHLRGMDCPYCRTAFPHHARAAEHAAVVQRVMHDNLVAAQLMGQAYLQPFTAADAFVRLQVGSVDSTIRRTSQAISIAVVSAIALSVLAVVASAIVLS